MAGGPFLIIEELFQNGDPRFLTEMRGFSDPKGLTTIVDRWRRDPRPWAREQALAYALLPMDAPGHQPVVKRLFKQAEEQRWHEVMAGFLVAFDRSVRRRVVKHVRWDFHSRTTYTDEALVVPRDVLPSSVLRRDGKQIVWRPPGQIPHARKGARLFSYRTRRYMRRRVWRYFRYLGAKRGGGPEYIAAVCHALKLYTDADLATGINVLDSKGLLHILYHDSPLLEFTVCEVRLREGASLNDLKPAPWHRDYWGDPAAFALILDVLIQSSARFVRFAMMELLRADHAERLAALPARELLGLLDHEDGEVRQFGAALLSANPSLGVLPLETWFRLLETRDESMLALIVEALGKHVSPARLSFADCVRLAGTRSLPVARVGFGFLQQRGAAPGELEALLQLADARCESLAGDLARFALGQLAAEPRVLSLEELSLFLDSRSERIRGAAWDFARSAGDWLKRPEFFARLVETPHPDLRELVVGELEKQEALLPGSAALWATVLLSIHRGSRAKPRAARQAAEAVSRDPALAGDLIPPLCALLRSLRGPEVRQAVGALATIAQARPELIPAIQKRAPELVFFTAEGPGA